MNNNERVKLNDGEKVSVQFTVGEIKEMLLPLYEFSIFDMIRQDEEIDNPRWLRGQMKVYARLLSAIGEDDEE